MMNSWVVKRKKEPQLILNTPKQTDSVQVSETSYEMWTVWTSLKDDFWNNSEGIENMKLEPRKHQNDSVLP